MYGFPPLKSCLSASLLLLSSASAAVVPKAVPGSNVHHFVLTKESANPDGSGPREMYKINGQFPAPAFSATEGDVVEVILENKSGGNSTIHFHGVEQIDTPWSDGTPGLAQYDTQTGGSFHYKFTANKPGSYFYHSHVGDLMDGLYGAFTVHPKANTATPYHLISNDSATLHAIGLAEKARIPMLISDSRNWTSAQDWEISEQSQIENLCVNSILINGRGRVNCMSASKLASLETPGQASVLGNLSLTDKGCLPPSVIANKISVNPSGTHIEDIPDWVYNGCQSTDTAEDVIKITQKSCETQKWVMLDLIGGMAQLTVRLSIDEVKEMFVISADGNFMEPVSVNAVDIASGMRYTVLLRLPEPKKYTVRVASITDSQIVYGNSIIDFSVAGKTQGAQTTDAYINEGGAVTSSDVVVLNPDALVNHPKKPVPNADATFKVNFKQDGSEIMWAFNETVRPAYLDDQTPTLFNPRPIDDEHTITVNSNQEWVDYIMIIEPGNSPHPVHMHGKHFQILGKGQGKFPWNTVQEAYAANSTLLNLYNPQMRDTYVTPASINAPDNMAWMVVRRSSKNHGSWLFHCHIESHQRGGMTLAVQDGIDDLPAIPTEYRNYNGKSFKL